MDRDLTSLIRYMDTCMESINWMPSLHLSTNSKISTLILWTLSTGLITRWEMTLAFFLCVRPLTLHDSTKKNISTLVTVGVLPVAALLYKHHCQTFVSRVRRCPGVFYSWHSNFCCLHVSVLLLSLFIERLYSTNLVVPVSFVEVAK